MRSTVMLVALVLVIAPSKSEAQPLPRSTISWRLDVTDMKTQKSKVATPGDKGGPIGTYSGWTCTLSETSLVKNDGVLAEGRSLDCKHPAAGEVGIVTNCLFGRVDDTVTNLTLTSPAGEATLISLSCWTKVSR